LNDGIDVGWLDSERSRSGSRLPDSFFECDVFYYVEFYIRPVSTSG
jgi:hypothetical protein